MMRLGKTNYKVNKNGFGALPIQRRNKKDSIEIIQKAYDNGINFYDTARFYTDSEEKLGASLNEVRENVIIATKTGAENVDDFWSDLETSLKNLQTDYVEIYQFHNLPFLLSQLFGKLMYPDSGHLPSSFLPNTCKADELLYFSFAKRNL